jgi:hypothetical protein
MVHTEVVQKSKTHILCSKTTPPPPPPENRAVYEIMCTIYGRAGEATDDSLIRRMRIARWIPKATTTHSQYAILIPFPLQQRLHERTSVLSYKYIACLV